MEREGIVRERRERAMIVAEGSCLIEDIPVLGRVGRGIRRLLAECGGRADDHQEREQNPHISIIAMACISSMTLKRPLAPRAARVPSDSLTRLAQFHLFVDSAGIVKGGEGETGHFRRGGARAAAPAEHVGGGFLLLPPP